MVICLKAAVPPQTHSYLLSQFPVMSALSSAIVRRWEEIGGLTLGPLESAADQLTIGSSVFVKHTDHATATSVATWQHCRLRPRHPFHEGLV